MRDKTLIFLHIPKAAGSTMREILRRNFPGKRCYHLKLSRRYLLGLTSRYYQYDCVMGHFGYNIHRFIHRDCQYFTMLRDPVQRVISQYFHLRRRPDLKEFYRHVSRMSLEEFVDSRLSSNIYNNQTRMLSSLDGFYRKKFNSDDIGPAELARAKTALAEGMAAIGLMERFDESLIMFRRVLGLGDIRYVSRNVTRNKEAEVSARVIQRIRENNRYDLELYDFAVELMRGQVAAYEGDLEKEVREFRALNAAYAAQGGLGG